MRLIGVTISGADDATDPAELVALSQRYPFVEWGILLSARQMGTPRYPSANWLAALLRARIAAGAFDMRLSAHLCGRWCRDFLAARPQTVERHLGGFLMAVRRFQFNFTAEDAKQVHVPALAHVLNHPDRENCGAGTRRQWVIQLAHGHNAALLMELAEFGVDAAGLFDTSGGTGRAPAEWPRPFLVSGFQLGTAAPQYHAHGYAGGLGPHNLAAELRRISEACPGPVPVWVDMESGVRSPCRGEDRTDKLDLDKVRGVLEHAAHWMRHEHRERGEVLPAYLAADPAAPAVRGE